MSAHSFVSSTVNDILKQNPNDGSVATLKADVKIIGTSLYFIDDFLRSVLDIHASAAKRIDINMAPTDLLKDVLEPVQSILHQRDGAVDVQVVCPCSCTIKADCLRLKQIMINLGRNSTKFTMNGFVRFRAAVVDGLVELYVEDSGPGIPADKRDHMFEKWQTSLDVLAQGTGIGLSLSKNLVELMNGSLTLDDTYDSGVVGSPGARFAVKLNTPCIPSESILLEGSGMNSTSSTAATAIEAYTDEEGVQGLPESLSVLFVDDDNVLRKLFSRSIKKIAPTWKISEAASGEAALELLETEDEPIPSLIFMDQVRTFWCVSLYFVEIC